MEEVILIAEELSEGSYIRVEEDAMTAWLYLYPPREGQIYTSEDLKEYIRSQGVVCGLHESNIEAMVKKEIYHREVRIAVGRAAGKGEDGYYEYLFTPVNYRAPAIRPDGTADYTSMSMLQNVAKGEKIAVYHPARQGENGCSVLGGETIAKPVRELPPIRGRNILLLEDGITYAAAVDGKVELHSGRVDVQNTHEIDGDVTLITGKVEFYGDVIIKGSVESGVVIRAGRNIVVMGAVEGANMYAGGDIILSRGINGGAKAKISARGNIFADFIENTNVSAGGSIHVNSILNSYVSADGMVILTGKKGFLIGGYTHGLKGVEAAGAGNSSEIKTVIHAGYDTATYEKYLNIHRRQQELQIELAEAVDEMSQILKDRKSGRGNARGADEKLIRLNRKKDECFEQLNSMKHDKGILAAAIENGKGASIKVKGTIHRGTIICLETVKMPLEHNTSYMRYSVENGAIEGKVMII